MSHIPHALNPIQHPWQAAKGGFLVAWRRLQGGALEANPWGTLVTLRYVYGTILYPPDKPRAPGLEVAQTESDAQGFALYGTVRASGVNVIPPC